jgi:hypothetical protein
MAEIEAVVEPDCVGDDVGWEAVSLISIHSLILSVTGF